jgi:glycosyltransferase involved in cell wall biosynthesis
VRRIKVLHPLSAWGGGHVQTCINILKGMVRAGADVHLELPRVRVDMGDVPHRTSIGRPLSRFGMPRAEPRLRRMAERRFLDDLREDDIAWLWPAVPLEIYREVARRGNPILMEGINTRIANARHILEPIHAAEGLPPPYTPPLPETAEDEMLSLASWIYAPNPHVAAAVEAADSPFAGTVLPTSYGAWMREGRAVDRSGRNRVTVLFVGTLCIRKNVQGLLRAWTTLNPPNARLVLCGPVEPWLAQVCPDELTHPAVEARGRVADVGAAYAEADVFIMPSFEEGGPQVTFEAATFGLPLIASPMGGGGMEEATDAIWPIDPHDKASMIAALERFIGDADLRAEYGARALAAAPAYDWDVVGRTRLEMLARAIGRA